MGLPRVGCLQHPLAQHVPRAVGGTEGYIYVSVKHEIYWMMTSSKENRSCIVQPVPEIYVSFSKASRGRVGSDRAAHT